LAASQVIAGFDSAVFERRLLETPVGISLSKEGARTVEGRRIADLSVRLLARLYPLLNLRTQGDRDGSDLADLARSINPEIEFVDDAPIGIAIGANAPTFGTSIFAGSEGWIALVGTAQSHETGNSRHGFGAGVAACLAAAALFRANFAVAGDRHAETDVTFDAWGLDRVAGEVGPERVMGLPPDSALVGLGAIGHGAAWSLENAAVRGSLHIVDPEEIDLGNLQRYVMATCDDVGLSKTDLLRARLATIIDVNAHATHFEAFVDDAKHELNTATTALDSAADRRAVQASLPRRMVNAWTQPGDLGVSVHGTFGGKGACIECLYRIDQALPNEDEIVATALGIPDQVRAVRQLLFQPAPVPAELLGLIGERLGIERSLIEPFAGASIRELYATGLCGGALVPMGSLGDPRPDVHVPLAHQSALAGVLLGSALVRAGQSSRRDAMSWVTRLNVLGPLGVHLRQPIAARPRGCICRDNDYVQRYRAKWRRMRTTTNS
jgi:hypothetical protein